MVATRCRLWCWALVALGLSPTHIVADSPDQTARDVVTLAAHIDQVIAAKWAAQRAKPTHAADDAEFLRRVHLDLVGRIPTVADVRAFLDDRASDKRLRVVQRLLDHPQYVEHFTAVWRQQMLPQNNDQNVQFLAQNLEV